MSDADGDSTMHSSPDIGGIDDDDDNMFPDEANQPSTPRNAANAILDRNAELSPPDSHGPPQTNRADSFGSMAGVPGTLNANGKRVHASAVPPLAPGVSHTDQETGYQWNKQEDQPGWEWKNTRAKEEEHRSWESIIDKGAMIKTRYGDPLDSTVPAKRR
ncbi:hypothetical protein B0J11DRAFT_540465 [Dendryphion nanum]|uniref:Uncharacterized protein n=1 Tax=Dendryphion nanum TaxID=256645 RepID=A0A9P9D8F1_9PLEO|nr:hypothetical protein B0J11DRAFT_540465 [Dendryphion nanum]